MVAPASRNMLCLPAEREYPDFGLPRVDDASLPPDSSGGAATKH